MAITVTVDSFREDFPEFASSTIFLDSMVTFWLNVAKKIINEARWDDLADYGTELFIAHNLSLQVQDIYSAQSAAYAASVSSYPVNTPPAMGTSSNAVKSEAVDRVNVAYDLAVSTLENGGTYNLTRYGVQFLYFARMAGAGGIQL